MTDAKAMALWVKELRAKTGMTQRALGEKCGVTDQYIAVLEMGGRCPGRPVLILMRQISDLIGMPAPPECVSPMSKQGRPDED